MKHKRLRMIPEHSEYTFVYTERIFVINQYPKKQLIDGKNRQDISLKWI